MDVSGTTVLLKDCYFYLLYKRKGDEQTQIPILLDKTYDSATDTISASFEPTSYFTEKNGGLDIQVFACSTEQDFISEDVDIEDVALWTSFNAQISIAKSQLKDSQTIVAEDMFTKGIAEMSAYLDSADADALVAEGFANGQQNGTPVGSGSPYYNNNSKYFAQQAFDEADNAWEFANDAQEWAKGTRSDDVPLSHQTSNSKYFAETSREYAEGKKLNGDPVVNGETGFHDNSKYYKDLSKDWANSNSIVESTGYSAKDWATKTSSKVDGTDYSAKYNALLAKDWASKFNDADPSDTDPVEDGNYSAKKYAYDANVSEAEATEQALKSEGYAVGKQGGTPVGSTSPYYHNNSSYYNTQAGIAKTGAESARDRAEEWANKAHGSVVAEGEYSAKHYATEASTSASEAEDWAEKDTEVETGKYSAKYHAAEAKDWANKTGSTVDGSEYSAKKYAQDSAASALESEGWADGTQGGTPVTSDSPYYENNAKYWKDQAEVIVTGKEDASNKVTSWSATPTDTHYPSEKLVHTEVTDLKSAISFNRKRIENLEQKSGSVVDVDYPDYSPYGEVPTGKAKNAIVSKLRGVSVAWNQQVKNGNFSDTSNWEGLLTSLSASQNKLTATVVGSTANYALAQQTSVVYKTGHKYLLSCDYDCSGISNFAGFVIRIFADPNEIYRSGTIKGTAIVMTSITTGTTSGRIQIGSLTSSAPVINDSLTIANVESYDLTQTFGSSVADYLYSIEQATTGAGVALFKALCKAQDNSHETGRLVSTVYESVGSRGKNLWDEQWRLGYYSSTTGVFVPGSSVANLNPIRVLPSTGYYLTVEYNFNAYFYDEDGNFLSWVTATTHTFNTPPSCYYVNFRIVGEYGSTYKDDLCLMPNSITDKSYVPYMTDSLPLPSSVTLRGILKVVNNNLVVDGDEYDPETGEIERNYVDIDLGSYQASDWGGGTQYLYYVPVSSMVLASDRYHVIECLIGKGLMPYTRQTFYDDATLQGICGDAGYIYVRVTGVTNTSDLVTWLQGVHIVGKAVIPSSGSVAPVLDPTLATEGGGTLSTTQTNDPAIVSAMQISCLTL